MKGNLSIAIVLALMLSVADSPTASPQNLLPESISPAKAVTGSYRLIEAKGEVLVHRLGDENLRLLSVNAQIYPGDLLIVRKGAIATVRCADGRNWTLPEGVSGVLNGCQWQNSRDPNIPRARTANDNSPYIISPRYTALLSLQPLLRWHPVPGANRYTVKVKKGSEVIWEVQVSSSKVVYSGKPLQRGIDYQLIVQDDAGNSSDGESAKFWLLDELSAQKAQGRLETLTQQGLSDRAEALAKAHVCSAYGLFADAIEALEGLVASGNQTAAIYQMLGALYEQVGLTEQAGLYYSRAIAFVR